MLKPIPRDAFVPYDEQLARNGAAQAHATGVIGERLDAVPWSASRCAVETQRLSQALRAPTVRGQWGELQLRRVFRTRGHVGYCDFGPQVSAQ
ncbi:MAG: DNA recombination protein RmuC [Gemmatimonadaceae bacterium]|nr:DNA recombination protein RmuC [Gemmatimonadaceae bacterium]